MINFVVWLWNVGFRDYRPEHVNMLANAIHRFYPYPHKVICITDETTGFSGRVTVMKTPKEARSLVHLGAPQGSDFPSCYRRLWCFSEAATVLGERIMLLDVDCAITGPLKRLTDTEGDFVGWRPMSIWGREHRIGGGTWMHRTGTLSWLWDDFIKDPDKMIAETRAEGWNGSDQAILSRFLARKYPTWPQMCGIYGTADGVFVWDMPPKDAVIVHFNSDQKAWGQDKLWMKAYCNYFKTGGVYEKSVIAADSNGRMGNSPDLGVRGVRNTVDIGDAGSTEHENRSLA